MSRAQLLPSMREATLANTATYGPKVSHRVTPSELAARAAEDAAREAANKAAAHAAAAQSTLLPSMREATLANTAKFGPKAGSNRPSDVSAATRPVDTTAAVAVADVQGSTPAVMSEKAVPAAQKVPVPAQVTPAAPAASVVPAPVAAATSASAKTVTSAPITSTPPSTDARPSSLVTNLAMTALAVGAAALTVVSIYKGVEMYNRYHLRRCAAEMERQQPEVVHLYIHRRSPLAPSLSVPCTQLETFLRVTGIPYEAHVVSDPSLSPNGRLPFVAFAGERTACIPAIVERLSVAYGVDLDASLSPEDRATGSALLAALHYSLPRGYLRSIHVDAPELIQPYYTEMNQTPDWVTRMALSRMRKDAIKTITTTGYSKLTVEQYQQELYEDTRAIEGLLMNGTNFLWSDDRPSTYDCALYAWLLPVVAMADAAEVNDAFEYAVRSEPITAFVKCMTDLAFPDLDSLVNEGRASRSVSQCATAPEEAPDADTEAVVLNEPEAQRCDVDSPAAMPGTSPHDSAHVDKTSTLEDTVKMVIAMVDSPTDSQEGGATAALGVDLEEL